VETVLKFKILSLAVIGLLALTLMGGCACPKYNPLSPDTANLLKGRVVEYLSSPTSGETVGVGSATVVITGNVVDAFGALTSQMFSDSTAANGDFSFKSIPVGTWTISVAKDGYNTETTSITVTNQMGQSMLFISGGSNDSAQGVAFISAGNIVIFKKTWTMLTGKIAPNRDPFTMTAVKIVDTTNGIYTNPGSDGMFTMWVPANSPYSLDISVTGSDILGNSMKLVASKSDTSKGTRRTVVDPISLARTPSLPTTIAVTSSDSRDFTVTWDAVPDNVNVRVEYKQDTASVAWTPVTTAVTKSASLVVNLGGPATARPNGKFYVRVYAVDLDSYYSTRSDVSTVTMSAQ
jgi:hypothetical protein